LAAALGEIINCGCLLLKLLVAKVPHFARTKLGYRSRWARRWIEKP
jgi:hypothetical protein